MDGMKLFAIYLAVMNVLGVAVMWSDKHLQFIWCTYMFYNKLL